MDLASREGVVEIRVAVGVVAEVPAAPEGDGEDCDADGDDHEPTKANRHEIVPDAGVPAGTT